MNQDIPLAPYSTGTLRTAASGHSGDRGGPLAELAWRAALTETSASRAFVVSRSGPIQKLVDQHVQK